MRKTILLIASVSCIFLAYHGYQKIYKAHSGFSIVKPLTPSSKNEEEVSKEEEIKERIEQEIAMTKDPSLGYVPVERLVQAELQAKRMSMLARGQNTLNTLALTWTDRGPSNLGGRSRAVLIDNADATGNTVFIGSVGGGLWRTTNFKAASPTWAQIASVSSNLAITALAQDPATPTIMYAGTGEGYSNFDAIRGLGIYKSTDGGLTWSLLASTTTGGANATDFSYVQKILVYTNGDVYASGKSAVYCNKGGVFKSTNGGTSWTRVIGTYDGSGFCTGAVDFGGYDIEKSVNGDLYVSVEDFSNVADNYNLTVDTTVGKVYYSSFAVNGVNVGNIGTWVNVTPPPPAAAGSYWQRIELACSPVTNGKLYALMQGTGNSVGGIRVTTNSGSTWTNIDNGTLWCDNGTSSSTDFSRGQAWYDLALAIKPDDDQTVFAGGVDLMKTTNGGSSWAQNTQWASGCASLPYVHADNHNIIYFPGSTIEFIVVNDGGVYYSGDGGNTYTNKSAGYQTIQYYGAAIHPTLGSNYMLAGAQDNGSHKFNSAGLNSVTSATGGDGGFCFIDQDNPNYQITSYTGLYYTISRDAGANFNVNAYFSGASRFINPTDYDNTQNIIYAGYNAANLARITNIISGAPAAVTINFASAGTRVISAVKVDPNTANRVWVAFSSGSLAPQLYYVDNANSGTPAITSVASPTATAGVYISNIDIEQGNASHLVLTISNYGVASVYESTNLGTSWTSLDNNGVNLPDVPVRWAIFLPTGYNFTGRTEAIGGIMLATELGVWTTTSPSGTTTTWTQSTGMPNVRVDMLVRRSADQTIVAATHGRGLFTTQLNAIMPVMLLNFQGHIENKAAMLNWSTGSEINSKDFDIEKSTNGADYYKIGSVRAAGSSSTVKNYSLTDSRLSPVNYYRLRMNDVDGKNTLSQVVILRYNEAVQNVWVLNNPIKNYIDLGFAKTATQARVQLIAGNGAVVAEKIIRNPAGQMRWELQNNLSAGIYIVKTVVDGQVFTTKLVRQ